MTSSTNLPPHNPLQRDQRRFHPPFGLWGHLSRNSGITQPNPPSSSGAKSTIPSIAPLDKAGASTRILLHDTQANLEKFTDRITQLTTGVADAKRELVAVQKLYQGDHEQLVERMIGLANRCQTELQKTIGTPAQSSDLRDTLRAVEGLGRRLEVLDKKVDVLTMGQSQALQNLQDQQGQILTALLPVLPLLQAIPLHIESARNHVKEAVSDSKSEVKLWITDSEARIKKSYEVLDNQIRGSFPQEQVKKSTLALRPHVQDSVPELRQHVSSPVEAASPADRLARGTFRSRSGSQKRPRSGSPSDTGSSDPATSPSDSKKRRLGNPSGRTASPARSSHPLSGLALGRIHTPTVPPTTATRSSSHASPDVSLLPAVVRSSDRLVRRPLADLDLRTPKATLKPTTPAAIVSSAPKQLRGSRSTLHTRPTAPAIAPSRTFSTQSTKAKAQAMAVPAGSTAHTLTPPPICAAPITPGSFKLPLPALGLSRTATATPQPRTTTTLNRSTSSVGHSVGGETARSSGAPAVIQAQTSRSTRTLTAPPRGVAGHDTSDGGARVFGVGLPVGVGVGGGGTPGTPRLAVDASASPGVAPLPPPSAGKPMSLRDRRAMLAEDRLRDEGKRFIPLDDEEDEDVETAG